MNRFIVVIVFLQLLSSNTDAQIAVEYISNNTKVGARADGILFTTADGKNAYYYPANSSKSMAALGAFWISARTQDSILLQSSIINPLQPEFWSGPIDTLTRKSKNPDNWNSVYVANAAEIKSHRENFNAMGYTVPHNIANWPGNSLAGAALPSVLAPYIDWDMNGLYSPEKGDFPAIFGNSALYQIYNDEYGEHNTSAGIPLKAQISQMVFNYAANGMDNVTFVQAFIKNMGDFDWKECYIGFYTDVVLGNPNDNFVSTDVNKHLIYSYNGDDNDEGEEGYGTEKPYLGQIWLNRNLSSTAVFDGNLPKTSTELRNIMKGFTLDGQLKYDSTGGSKFAFPGNSDLTNTKVEISETTLKKVPGNRKMLSVIGPIDLEVGKSYKLDIAFFAGVTNTSLHSTIENQSKLINEFYSKTLNALTLDTKKSLRIYPNPINRNDDIKIELPDNQAWTLDIIDPKGAIVFHSDNQYKNIIIASNNLSASSVYYIRAISNKNVLFKKVVIN